jgi:hypothetical protein
MIYPAFYGFFPIKLLQVLLVTYIIHIQYRAKTFHMTRISIELDWPRDPKGYRLAETGYPKQLRIAPNGTKKSLPSFQPLASTDTLFEIFANIATSPEGALDFVQRYGPLTWDGGTQAIKFT